MKLSQKLLVSILATASLFGISFANQSNHQANASMRHYTRYINGKYNAYHNVPGKRNAYVMHYGHDYRNDRVSTMARIINLAGTIRRLTGLVVGLAT